MKPYIHDPDFTLYVGDVRDVLRELPDASVDCVATSPPFYALRDYGMDGQIGLEETPEQWVDELVGVFREARRVLSSTGTLWVECGDSYVAGHGGSSTEGKGVTLRKASRGAAQPRERSDVDVSSWGSRDATPHHIIPGRKPKDLLGQPWMLAFALRADGWWLRQSIIWHKPNAMPESATDRCTTNHSYVFLLSKQARYHFDSEAIAEPAAWERWGDQSVPKHLGTDTAAGWIEPRRIVKSKAPDGWDTGGGGHGTIHRDGREKGKEAYIAGETKNPRSVWTIPTRGYSEAHFATWPEALVERIIKAGCPEGGTVLDPFMGSGTTALVARRLGRKSVGIELNPEYADLCARRLQQLSLLAEDTAA